MRRYLRRVENCGYRPFWRWLSQYGIDPTGHGWSGWLHTERAMPTNAFTDDELRRLVVNSIWATAEAASNPLHSLMRLIRREGDPNDQRTARRGFQGIAYTPLSTAHHGRVGTYQRIREVAARHPDRLRVELNALATRVILDEGRRAIGVDYLKGARLYRADPNPAASSGTPRQLRVRREVIVSGGAFNTPQLLMLSGIGPSAELGAHGIPVQIHLPGVGRNLQDRYEIAVVNHLKKPWSSLEGARFDTADQVYREWQDRRCGMYISNGSAIAVTRRSAPHKRVPDLFCMALLARFYGYFPGYSRQITEHSDYLSWAILKAHTNNRAGTVTLRSRDPRDPPLVNFHYFEQGDDDAAEDLQAVVAGIRFVRHMVSALNRSDIIAIEEKPGPDCVSDEALAAYVRNNTWGHHASCSCAIGPRAANGVLGSDFTVHGTHGLRVVDASIFPRIPGYFIASAIYIAAEKAADAILSSAMAGNAADVHGELTSPRRPASKHQTGSVPPRASDVSVSDFYGRRPMAYDIGHLLKMTTPELDALFTNAPVGDIPDGEGKGTAIIGAGTMLTPAIASFINHFAWQGKVFDAKAGLLRNLITPFGLRAVLAKVYKGTSWFDGKECIVLDYSETSIVAGWIRDEIRMIEPKFYLGEVFGEKTRIFHFTLQF
jgi:choline dehydrogenase-like flavoprotein